MAAQQQNDSTVPGHAWKQYAAGGPYNLIADGPTANCCARQIVLLAAGDLTACVMGDAAATNRPLTNLPAGYTHVGHTASVTPSVAIVVYW
jgi:hypothetical protein